MDPTDATEPRESRDDVSSIVSFELVRTASAAKSDWTVASTIAVNEPSPTEEATIALPANAHPPPPEKIQIWRDVVKPWMFFGRAVLLDSWWLEAAALAISFSCLVEIAVTLTYYNGLPVSQLPLGLTLNTTLSLLAAGSKSSLMFAVAGTMSQCKWCWLRSRRGRRRRLKHLQVLDEASRGPLGSLFLLLGDSMAFICYLGAIIIVLGLAYEPFVQQVISYPVQRTNTTASDGDATTIQALGVDPNPLSPEAGSMQGYVLAGMVAGVYGSSFPESTPPCSTGNCTWDPFWSVGWCAKCEHGQLEPQSCNLPLDVLDSGNNFTKTCDYKFSDSVDTTALRTTFEVNDGILTISYPQFWPLLLPAYNATNTTPILEYFHISANGLHPFLSETNPLLALGYAAPIQAPEEINTYVPSSIPAYQCILSPCSKKYNVSVANGISVKLPIDEDYGTVFKLEGDDSSKICWRPKDNNLTKVELDPDGYLFNRRNRIWCGIDVSWIETILSLFEGDYNTTWRNNQYGGYAPPGRTGNGGNDLLDDILYDAFYDAGKFMPDISEALSYFNLHGSGVSPYLNPLNGTIFTDRTIVVARWVWLSLPFTLTVLGLVFLIMTAVYTKRHHVPIWKSSAFAMLYHGLDDDQLDDEKLYKRASDMESAASTTYVKLAPADDGRKRLLLRT